MEPEFPGERIFRLIFFSHEFGPYSPCSAKLGNLFKEVIMGCQKKRKARGEGVHLKACFLGSLDIGGSISQGESQFLNSRSSRFSDMVAADAHRVPLRNIFLAEGKNVCDDFKRSMRRVYIGSSRDIFLENIAKILVREDYSISARTLRELIKKLKEV